MTLPTLSESDVRGLLLSASVRFNTSMEGASPQDKGGSSLVDLFLGTILHDSCTLAVKQEFIRSFVESYDRLTNPDPYKPKR